MNQYDRLFKMLEAKISTKKKRSGHGISGQDHFVRSRKNSRQTVRSNIAPQSGQSAKDTLVPLGTPPKSVSDKEHSQRQGTIQLKKAAKKITGTRKSLRTRDSEKRAEIKRDLHLARLRAGETDLDEGRVGDALKKIGGKVKKTAAVGALCVAGACSNADAPKSADTAPQGGATTHQTERPMSQRRARAQKNIEMLNKIGNAAQSGASQETQNKMAGRGEAKHTDPIKAELDKNKGSEGGAGYQPKGKGKVKPKPKPKPTPGSGVSADDDDI